MEKTNPLAIQNDDFEILNDKLKKAFFIIE